MDTRDFDYELPPDRIAQTPIEPRDAARLMVLHRTDERTEHRVFRAIGDYLGPGDLLILNDTRVIPARLFGSKTPTGGRVELLLLRPRTPTVWEALVKGSVRVGTRIEIEKDGLTGEVIEAGETSERVIAFERPVSSVLGDLGAIPLPPYIHTPLQDPERYQTIYARSEGAVAAPTAGLHFTPELMLRLREGGVGFAYVTLHIGLDTFRPVTDARVEAHRIHSEWARLPVETAEAINRTKLSGGRVVAVGTTAVRTLETAARRGLLQNEDDACPWRPVAAFEGQTDLFIFPAFHFRAVDALITNFHLPRSTLIMLVSAFAGRAFVLRAYQEAIHEGYRFYSFGDAMLIL
jgi:S-adenosylmethionine:tRNA ribosyltransferase-isomerase